MRFLGLIVMAAALCAGVGLVEAQTTPDPDGNSSATRPPDTQRFGGLTPSGMMRAKQVTLPNVDPQKVRAAYGNKERSGKQAVPGSTDSASLAAPKMKSTGVVTTRPLYWAGKLFFKKPDGLYVCSAQFISPTVILTAGHCVRDPDTGKFYEGFVFALQYNKGHYSKRYSFKCVATNNGWVAPEPDRYLSDFAMIEVDGTSPTGNFGTEWNWLGEYKDATKIGYPGGIDDGETIQVDKGPISVTDGIVQIKHGNPAEQGGSSGGAWIGKYTDANNDASNYIISIESFGYDGVPGIDYGPYLDDRFKSLADYVENDCQDK